MALLRPAVAAGGLQSRPVCRRGRPPAYVTQTATTFVAYEGN
jgi:hypothetical protein